MFLAGLLGVRVGLALRGARRGPESDVLTVIGPSTLLATPALAHLASEALGLERSDARVHAVLSFVVGAVLAFFTDSVTKYLPRAATSKSSSEG